MDGVILRFADAVIEGNALELALFVKDGRVVFSMTEAGAAAVTVWQAKTMVKALQQFLDATEAHSKGEPYTYTL